MKKYLEMVKQNESAKVAIKNLPKGSIEYLELLEMLGNRYGERNIKAAVNKIINCKRTIADIKLLTTAYTIISYRTSKPTKVLKEVL